MLDLFILFVKLGLGSVPFLILIAIAGIILDTVMQKIPIFQPNSLIKFFLQIFMFSYFWSAIGAYYASLVHAYSDFVSGHSWLIIILSLVALLLMTKTITPVLENEKSKLDATVITSFHLKEGFKQVETQSMITVSLSLWFVSIISFIVFLFMQNSFYSSLYFDIPNYFAQLFI